MANKLYIVDLATGQRKILKNLWVDQDFEVSSSAGQVDFVPTQVFSAENKIDVFVDGILTRVALEYTRNETTNTITFTYTVPQYSWVRIRIYLAG